MAGVFPALEAMKRMAVVKRKSTVPYYAAAGVWLLYAAFFPLYRLGHFLLVAGVSAAVFLLMKAICGTVVVGEQEEKKEEKPKEEKPTGNAELDKMLKDGALAISEMKRLDDAIEDAQISADIVRLEQVSQKIFDYVKANPSKLPEIRRFMDYYLPTTLKILNAYDRASSAGVSGENINATLTKVESMMKSIVSAFEKQLDSLYGAESMDVSADIAVLETMLQREGLAGEPELHAADGGASAAQDFGDIRLEL